MKSLNNFQVVSINLTMNDDKKNNRSKKAFSSQYASSNYLPLKLDKKNSIIYSPDISFLNNTKSYFSKFNLCGNYQVSSSFFSPYNSNQKKIIQNKEQSNQNSEKNLNSLELLPKSYKLELAEER